MGKKKTGGYSRGPGRPRGSRPPTRPPLTHFLCIPLVTDSSRPALELALGRFRHDVLRDQGAASRGSTARTADVPSLSTRALEQEMKSSGAQWPQAANDEPLPAIPEKAIRPIGTLHLTLGVMSLTTEDRIQAAAAMLESLDLHRVLSDSLPEAWTARTARTATRTAKSSKQTPDTKPMAHDPADQDADPSGGVLLPSSRASKAASPAATAGRAATGLAGRAQEESDRTPRWPPPPGPLAVSLTSLRSMSAATKTSVLYAAPHDPTNRIYPFCAELRARFTEAGFVLAEDRPLKLHATVVNMIYAKQKGPGRGSLRQASTRVGVQVGAGPITRTQEPGPGHGDAPEERERKEQPGTRQPLAKPIARPGATTPRSTAADTSSDRGPEATPPFQFDATALLERYKDFVWAEGVVVEKVAICKMGAREIRDAEGRVVDVEYEEVASVRM